MKINLPTLDQEYEIEPGITIVSKTDLRGIITYANDAFITVSGFEREELIGKSHNIVRHPDMPPQAFADMWKTLKSGQPWKGIVKNRRKDGGYYWVEACVVPIRKDDETIGYMSVRQKATPEAIAAAEALYERLRKTGAAIPHQNLKNMMTIRAGFVLGSLFVVALMVAGGILGIGGLRMSNSAVETMYQNLLNPVASVGRITSLMADTRTTWVGERLDTKLAAKKPDSGAKLRDTHLAAELSSNRQEVERLMGQLAELPLASSDHKALDDFQFKYKTFAERVLIPLEESLNTGLDASHLDTITSRADPLYREASEAGAALEHSLMSTAAHNYEDMRSRNELIWKIALAGILFGITMVVVVGRIFMRDIVKPLDEAIHAFDRIAQGDLSHEVNIYGKGETGQLIRASATMQLHLKVMMDELTLVTNNIYAYCGHLNESVFEVSEHSEEQHHRVYQAKEAVDTAAQEAVSVSLQVESLLAALEDVKSALPRHGDEAGEPMANLEGQIANLATTLRVQAFAADEVALKMHQIASLIVENRQKAQDAYAVSEQVKAVADELKSLVSYFETRKTEGSNAPAM